MLEVSNLAAGYGWSPVFRNISFRLRRGEVVGLAAPNGVGKTTLMRALAGDVPVGKGSVVEADGQKRLPGRSRRWPVYYSGWQQVTQRCPLSALSLWAMRRGVGVRMRALKRLETDWASSRFGRGRFAPTRRA